MIIDNYVFLIVEDDDFSRKMLNVILKPHIKHMFIAKDGLEAYEIFRKNHIDIILTDIEMPNLDGIELIKKIRKENSLVPVIAVTAYDDKELLKKMLELQFDGYIQKPITVEKILNVLERILSSEKYVLLNKAYEDSLTKCKNRKFFDDKINSIFYKANIQKSKLALIYIDLNKFKEINDTYGHKIGDIVLQKFAEQLQKSIRENDLCIRLGGDEFLIILNNIELDNLNLVIKRLQTNCCFNLVYSENKIAVTHSLGISIYPDDSDNLEKVINLADKAMYKAKSNGKCLAVFAKDIKEDS